MQGRVAVLKAYGGEFELREYPVPDPEPGAILIRLSRAGVCGSDLHIWRGEMKEVYGPLPRDLTFGHEMCGRVARLGTGVSVDSSGQPLHEGDRVAFVYFFPCGRCPVCLRGEMGSCPRKGRANRVAGTPPYFNNAYGDYYYLRPGAAVFRIPDEISDDIATPANCALAQVLYGLTRAGLRQGDTAVIQGAGGLGLNAIAVARDMGADRVIVLDRIAARLELARELRRRPHAEPRRLDHSGAPHPGGHGSHRRIRRRHRRGFRRLSRGRAGGDPDAAQRRVLSRGGLDRAGQRVFVRRDGARPRQLAPGRDLPLLAGGAGPSPPVRPPPSRAL